MISNKLIVKIVRGLLRQSPCVFALGGGGGGGEALSLDTVVGLPYTASVIAEYQPLIIRPSVGTVNSNNSCMFSLPL
jgi:hypothetical protein